MEIIIRLAKLFNIILMTVPVYFYWLNVLSLIASVKYYSWGNLAIGMAYALCYRVYARNYDVFRIAYSSLGELFYGQVLAAFFADCWVYGLFCLLMKTFYMPCYIFAVFVVQILVTLVWSRLARYYYFSTHPLMPTLVIYDERDGMERLVKDYGLSQTFKVTNVLHVNEAIQHPELGEDIKAVF